MDFKEHLLKYLPSDFVDELLISLEKPRTNSLILMKIYIILIHTIKIFILLVNHIYLIMAPIILLINQVN